MPRSVLSPPGKLTRAEWAFFVCQFGVSGDGAALYEVGHVRGLDEALQGAAVVGVLPRCFEQTRHSLPGEAQPDSHATYEPSSCGSL